MPVQRFALPLAVILVAGAASAVPSTASAQAGDGVERLIYSVAPVVQPNLSQLLSTTPDFADPDLVSASIPFAGASRDGHLAWVDNDATGGHSVLRVAAPGVTSVRDIDLPQATAGESLWFGDLAWSADSQRLAFDVSRTTVTTNAVTLLEVWTVPADGSAPAAMVPFSRDLFDPAFDPTDPSRLYLGSHDGLKTLRIGQRPAPVPGTQGISSTNVAITPDGQRLVYLTFRDDPNSGSQKQEILTTGVDGTDRRVLDPLEGDGTFAVDIALSLDGSFAYYSRLAGFVGDAGGMDVFRVPVDGSSAPRNLTMTPLLDERGVSVVAGPAPDPAAANHVRGTLAGSKAILTWRLPAGTSAVVVRRAAGGTVADDGPVLYAGPALTSLTSTVVVGRTYTYSVSSVDKAGVTHGPVHHRLTATAVPSFSLGRPDVTGYDGPEGSLGFPVRWGPVANPQTTSYQLQWAQRSATSVQGAWRSWKLVGEARGFFGGQPGNSGWEPAHVVPGGTWAMRARAMDRYGNFSLWSPRRLASAPYDDMSARYAGRWRHNNSSATWMFTLSSTRARGASATFRVHGTRLTLLGSRSPGSGKIAVYLDGRLVAIQDTRAPRVLARQALWVSVALSQRALHTVRVVALGTPGRPLVVLDGLLAPH